MSLLVPLLHTLFHLFITTPFYINLSLSDRRFSTKRSFDEHLKTLLHSVERSQTAHFGICCNRQHSDMRMDAEEGPHITTTSPLQDGCREVRAPEQKRHSSRRAMIRERSEETRELMKRLPWWMQPEQGLSQMWAWSVCPGEVQETKINRKWPMSDFIF